MVPCPRAPWAAGAAGRCRGTRTSRLEEDPAGFRYGRLHGDVELYAGGYGDDVPGPLGPPRVEAQP